MKRHHADDWAVTAETLELLSFDDDRTYEGSGIDALLRDGGYLATCILERLRRADDVADAAAPFYWQ